MKKALSDGGPAFPVSLRDWFAGMALQGMCAAPNGPASITISQWIWPDFAKAAYAAADAILAEREKKGARDE